MKTLFIIFAISVSFVFAQEQQPVVAPSKEKQALPAKKVKDAAPQETTSAVKTGQDSQVKPYKVRKSVIKDEVDALKTEVLSQKTQTVILKDLLKKEGLDGSKRPLIISFQNTLGNRYLIDSLTYKLNGDIIYQYVAEEQADVAPEKRTPKTEIQTTVVPGPYSLEVLVVYRGNDTGVFSYLKDYRITRENRFQLDVKKVDQTRVEVQTFESGSLFADFKDRPQLKISQK